MFSNPPHFLLLVPVAVFFPRFSHCPFYSSSFWGDWSAPWLVAHDGLDPLGERPHVLLKTEICLESIYSSVYSVAPLTADTFCTWWKKFLSTTFSILLIFGLFAVTEKSDFSESLFRNFLCCGWKSLAWVPGGGWQYRSLPCKDTHILS